MAAALRVGYAARDGKRLAQQRQGVMLFDALDLGVTLADGALKMPTVFFKSRSAEADRGSRAAGDEARPRDFRRQRRTAAPQTAPRPALPLAYAVHRDPEMSGGGLDFPVRARLIGTHLALEFGSLSWFGFGNGSDFHFVSSAPPVRKARVTSVIQTSGAESMVR